MTGSPSVVVVGAGALGLCTAYHLVRSGRHRRHRDRARPRGRRLVGAVGRDHRDAVPGPARDRDPRREHALLHRARALRRARRSPATATSASGIADADMEAFARSVEVQRTLGVTDCRVLERDDLRRLIPDMRVRRPRRRPVRSERRVRRWPPLLQRAGGRGHRPRRPGPAGARSSSAATRVPGIGTGFGRTAGDFECDVVVNAAGGWAGRVGDLLGAPIDDPAATAPGPDRAPGRAARVRHAVGHGLRAVVGRVRRLLPRRRARTVRRRAAYRRGHPRHRGSR